MFDYETSELDIRALKRVLVKKKKKKEKKGIRLRIWYVPLDIHAFEPKTSSSRMSQSYIKSSHPNFNNSNTAAIFFGVTVA